MCNIHTHCPGQSSRTGCWAFLNAGIAANFNRSLVIIKSDKKHVCLQNGLTEHDKRTVAMIMEMREVLNGDSVLQGFNNEEVTDILHSLCCD